MRRAGPGGRVTVRARATPPGLTSSRRADAGGPAARPPAWTSHPRGLGSARELIVALAATSRARPASASRTGCCRSCSRWPPSTTTCGWPRSGRSASAGAGWRDLNPVVGLDGRRQPRPGQRARRRRVCARVGRAVERRPRCGPGAAPPRRPGRGSRAAAHDLVRRRRQGPAVQPRRPASALSVPDDEELLETALDDRARSVREAALASARRSARVSAGPAPGGAARGPWSTRRGCSSAA